MTGRAWWVLLVLAAAPVAAAGQGLAQRVAATPDGTVRLTFPARDGVEVCSRGIRMGRDRVQWRDAGRGTLDERCETGPIDVEMRVVGGEIRSVDVLKLEQAHTAGARDLGQVSASDAAGFFLGVARRGASARGAREALLPAVLADVPEVWRDLLALAGERPLPEGVRTAALFWLGQEAAEAATEGLAEVAFAEDEDQDVRDAAVFALSQRPADEGVPVLMELARTAEQAKTRRSAFFWLAQCDDPRVVPFFEEILRGG